MPTDAIVPDVKDWTWVLLRPCPECGLDTRDVDPRAVGGMLRDNAASWREVMSASPAESLRQRPDPATWSTLEYACHVRDVFRLYDERLRLMLTQDGPHYPNWDQDATAVEARYGEQEPAHGELADIGGCPDEQLARRGIRRGCAPGHEQASDQRDIQQQFQERRQFDQSQMPPRIFQHHGLMHHGQFQMRGRIVDRNAGVFGNRHHDQGNQTEP